MDATTPQDKSKKPFLGVHEHARDWKQDHVTTIREVMNLARKEGMITIGDMANTDLDKDKLLKLPEINHFSPSKRDTLIQQVIEFKGSIVSGELVDLRLKTAEREGVADGYYLHVGATKFERQIVNAARVATENPKVLGIKDVFGKTTGTLSITERDDQEYLFGILKRERYEGVVTIHAEKESLARPDLWDPALPATWNLAKPPIMEIAAVRDTIRIVEKTGFHGHVHIAHTSVPESVDLVYGAKMEGMSISCGVTPHHLKYSTENMQNPESMEYKVNPPIRGRNMVILLRQQLREGKIDIIETDHAPHEPDKKRYNVNNPKDYPYMSGIRSLEGFSSFIGSLIRDGFTQEQISNLTYWNIKKIFKKINE